MSEITTEQIKELIEQGGAGRVTRENLQDFLRNPDRFIASGSHYLRFLSKQPLVIGPTDGSRIIVNATHVFKVGIDGDFYEWGTDEPGAATGETPVWPYELMNDATFAQMLRSLSPDVAKLCLTQDQIIEFVVTHRDQLRTGGYGNFFLFKSKGVFFVASVDFGGVGRLEVRVHRFARDCVWFAKNQLRLVVPQLVEPKAS